MRMPSPRGRRKTASGITKSVGQSPYRRLPTLLSYPLPWAVRRNWDWATAAANSTRGRGDQYAERHRCRHRQHDERNDGRGQCRDCHSRADPAARQSQASTTCSRTPCCRPRKPCSWRPSPASRWSRDRPGQKSYADLITLSKGNDWKLQMGVGGNDAVTAKDAVETLAGDNGVPWIGGQAGAPDSQCWNLPATSSRPGTTSI